MEEINTIDDSRQSSNLKYLINFGDSIWGAMVQWAYLSLKSSLRCQGLRVRIPVSSSFFRVVTATIAMLVTRKNGSHGKMCEALAPQRRRERQREKERPASESKMEL